MLRGIRLFRSLTSYQNYHHAPLSRKEVRLSDKIWKGKRIEELEEKIGNVIADKLNLDYWEVYVKLDGILEQISGGADKRILWQNQ